MRPSTHRAWWGVRTGVAILTIAAFICASSRPIATADADRPVKPDLIRVVSLGFGYPLATLDQNSLRQLRPCRNSGLDMLPSLAIHGDVFQRLGRAISLEPSQTSLSAHHWAAPPRAPPQIASIALT